MEKMVPEEMPSSGFYGAGKDNRNRHTNNPAGCHHPDYWCLHLHHSRYFNARWPSHDNLPNLFWLQTGTNYAELHTCWLGLATQPKAICKTHTSALFIFISCQIGLRIYKKVWTTSTLGVIHYHLINICHWYHIYQDDALSFSLISMTYCVLHEMLNIEHCNFWSHHLTGDNDGLEWLTLGSLDISCGSGTE